jgi:hypothetical protein
VDDLTPPAPLPPRGRGEFAATLSQKRLRALLRASPLVSPEMRAHWLRVLPHLTGDQRAELARLLESDAGEATLPPDVSRA